MVKTLRQRKKRFKNSTHKKGKNKSYNQKIYIFIKTFILLIILLYIGIYEYNILISNSFNEISIIESKEYKNFNKMINKITDPFHKTIMKDVNIIKHIFTDKTKVNKIGKNIIYITVSLNNNEDYKYILYVSMNSLLLSCNKRKTFVIYHILCSPDFNELSIDIFKPLLRNYSKNVEMIFYNMGNYAINRAIRGYPPATYYRLLTPLFIKSDRLIHLDGDCLIFTDLYEMYNLNFHGNYVLGTYDILVGGVDYLGIKSNIYINSGVILLNLKKIKRDKKIDELLNLTINSNITLKRNDQTAINYIFYPKIGRLPGKFGLWDFEDEDNLNNYLNILRTKIPKEEMIDALNNPGIIHLVLCNKKPWFNHRSYSKGIDYCKIKHHCPCKKYFDLWHSFAKKTEYYERIAKFTGVKYKL